MNIIYLKPCIDLRRLIISFFYRVNYIENELRFFTSGGEALIYGLKEKSIKEGSTILLPAYICNSVVKALKVNNYKIIFFDIKKDLTVDTKILKKYIKKFNIQCLLVVHYFGFVTNINEIKEICNKYKILLIEDCCHNFLTQNNNFSIGKMGDISIFSYRKTIPILFGGALQNNNHRSSYKYKVSNINLHEIIFILKRFLIKLIKHFGSPNLVSINSKFKLIKLRRFFVRQLAIDRKKKIEPNNPSFLLSLYLQDPEYQSKAIMNIKDNYKIINEGLNHKYYKVISNKHNQNEVLQFFIINNQDDNLIRYLRKNKIEVMRWPGNDLPCEVITYKDSFPNAVSLNKKIMLLPVHQGLSRKDCNQIVKILNNYYK